jgi:xanthine dehydrogenase YagS FAD-binding subunit
VNAFEYVNPSNLKDVPQLLSQKRDRKSVVMAGGIDLLGELKDNLIAPNRLVNIKALDLRYIKHSKDGVRIGATTTLSEVAADGELIKTYTALSEAAASVASLQIRNVGTLGGNLCQRPRCWYYRGEEFHCLKKGGHQCFAVEGENKYHAIMGGGPCHIVHPSDTAPALIALNASIKIQGLTGERTVPAADFFVLPMENLYQETVLLPNEVVTEVFVPKPKAGTKSTYLKFKEKGSMDFALAAAAVALRVEGGVCREAKVVLGGVAPKPWQADASSLVGQTLTEDRVVAFASAVLKDAEPLRDNAFKVTLSKTMIKRGVMALA